MRATPVWIAASLATSTLLACASPQPPIVVPQTVRIIGVSGAGLLLAVTLTVKNPNSFPLMAHRVVGDLYVGVPEHKLGTGQASPQQSIPSKGSGIVESKVKIRWQDMSLLGRLMGQSSLPYSFRGQVTLGGETLSLNLPFQLRGQLTREQLITAGLRGLGS